jgi:hypothetical protein
MRVPTTTPPTVAATVHSAGLETSSPEAQAALGVAGDVEQGLPPFSLLLPWQGKKHVMIGQAYKERDDHQRTGLSFLFPLSPLIFV